MPCGLARNKNCETCSVDFIAKKSITRYCSPRCNNLALYRLRDISAYNARKRKISTAPKRKKRYQNDLNFRLTCVLRARLKMAIKNNHKSGSAVKALGCSIDELKKYLESQFRNGMNWENYGRYGWHIDHIKPLTYFNLTDPEQLAKACHYTNLQPLNWRDNIVKGGC